jgi:cell division inhibitor SulA
MKTRDIKVSYLITKSLRFQGKRKETIKPKISFTGEWLKTAGFEIGKNIKIEVQQNKLILTT